MRSVVSAGFLISLILCGWLCGCSKVPLRQHVGEFEVLAGHYFENEKTQYLFFSVKGLRPEQAKLGWPSQFSLQVDGKDQDFVKLDNSKAVHEHSLVECAEGSLCGSYSFRSEQPPGVMRIRYKYHSDSKLSVDKPVPNSIHPAGLASDAQSAFVYGVFDKENERVQIRVHDNFGTPNSADTKRFGLKRRFVINQLRLEDIGPEQHTQLAQTTGANFLFPAEPCPDGAAEASGSTTATTVSTPEDAWWPRKLNKANPNGTACFKSRLVDRNGVMIREAQAIARRNPVLSLDPITLQSPLHVAKTLPLVISYCTDRADADQLTSSRFLNYQRFVLGIESSDIDACFAVGEEGRFGQDLERAINQKLAVARRTGSQREDLFFKVVINHRLSTSITRFHEIIKQKLSEKIALERQLVTPRLVGAFIYDSQVPEDRQLDIDPNSGIVWCPRLESGEGSNSQQGSCLAYGPGATFRLGPVNFLLPIGTFPTVSSFHAYVDQHGEKGLSRNPRFEVRAVRTNQNSLTLSEGQQITFFDGERINVSRGEGLKFCPEKDESGLLQSLAFRERGAPSSLQAIRALALGGERDLSLQVGISWEHPFLGGISYELPLRGQVFNIIPFSKSFRSNQEIGEAKWSQSQWPIGNLIQKCVRYCDHPVFDEAGVYQITSTWRNSEIGCREPKPVEAPDESR